MTVCHRYPHSAELKTMESETIARALQERLLELEAEANAGSGTDARAAKGRGGDGRSPPARTLCCLPCSCRLRPTLRVACWRDALSVPRVAVQTLRTSASCV
jgi:hypothetical protein